MTFFPKIILASASPARESLLRQIGLSFKVIPSKVDERRMNSNLKAYLLQLSFQKARSVEISFQKHNDSYIVIGCDTVVIDPYQNIIGKPKNRILAKKMLQSLSGNYHTVMTGCTIIIQPDELKYQTIVSTLVKFRNLSNDEIEFYLNKDEWKNKAGGYAIQGLGSVLIEEIQGDYYNVVGLPIHWIWQTLISHFGSRVFSI
ncbi:MAG: Maf family protein [Candidatus Hodarchaeota archaeon]